MSDKPAATDSSPYSEKYPVTSKADPAFRAWADAMPDKHWAKYDIGACAIGWDAGVAFARSEKRFAGWTFEPADASKDHPGRMTHFWGKVRDAEGRFVSALGEADALALFPTPSHTAKAISSNGENDPAVTQLSAASAARFALLRPEEITATGWYYRVEDDKYVRVESHRYPVMKSGFLRPLSGALNERYVERWETGLICEGSTYPPDWGQQFIGPLDRPRSCTCHPDDNPPRPCPQKFALNECRAAAPSAPSSGAVAIDRCEAVNLAQHIAGTGKAESITPGGVRCLVAAVIAMDRALSAAPAAALMCECGMVEKAVCGEGKRRSADCPFTHAGGLASRHGWMIERIKPLAFWDGTNVDFDRSCWTTDPNNAPVFDDATSALVVMMALGRYNRIKGEKLVERYRIAEHEWPGGKAVEPRITFHGSGEDLATDVHALLNDVERKRFAAKWQEREGSALSASALKTETGWLVENGGGGEALRYRTIVEGLPAWTEDHSKAIRFARRADAEMFAAEDDGAWRIAEHQWG